MNPRNHPEQPGPGEHFQRLLNENLKEDVPNGSTHNLSSEDHASILAQQEGTAQAEPEEENPATTEPETPYLIEGLHPQDWENERRARLANRRIPPGVKEGWFAPVPGYTEPQPGPERKPGSKNEWGEFVDPNEAEPLTPETPETTLGEVHIDVGDLLASLHSKLREIIKINPQLDYRQLARRMRGEYIGKTVKSFLKSHEVKSNDEKYKEYLSNLEQRALAEFTDEAVEDVVRLMRGTESAEKNTEAKAAENQEPEQKTAVTAEAPKAESAKLKGLDEKKLDEMLKSMGVESPAGASEPEKAIPKIDLIALGNQLRKEFIGYLAGVAKNRDLDVWDLGDLQALLTNSRILSGFEPSVREALKQAGLSEEKWPEAVKADVVFFIADLKKTTMSDVLVVLGSKPEEKTAASSAASPAEPSTSPPPPAHATPVLVVAPPYVAPGTRESKEIEDLLDKIDIDLLMVTIEDFAKRLYDNLAGVEKSDPESYYQTILDLIIADKLDPTLDVFIENLGIKPSDKRFDSLFDELRKRMIKIYKDKANLASKTSKSPGVTPPPPPPPPPAYTPPTTSEEPKRPWYDEDEWEEPAPEKSEAEKLAEIFNPYNLDDLSAAIMDEAKLKDPNSSIVDLISEGKLNSTFKAYIERYGVDSRDKEKFNTLLKDLQKYMARLYRGAAARTSGATPPPPPPASPESPLSPEDAEATAKAKFIEVRNRLAAATAKRQGRLGSTEGTEKAFLALQEEFEKTLIEYLKTPKYQEHLNSLDNEQRRMEIAYNLLGLQEELYTETHKRLNSTKWGELVNWMNKGGKATRIIKSAGIGAAFGLVGAALAASMAGGAGALVAAGAVGAVGRGIGIRGRLEAGKRGRAGRDRRTEISVPEIEHFANSLVPIELVGTEEYEDLLINAALKLHRQELETRTQEQQSLRRQSLGRAAVIAALTTGAGIAGRALTEGAISLLSHGVSAGAPGGVTHPAPSGGGITPTPEAPGHGGGIPTPEHPGGGATTPTPEHPGGAIPETGPKFSPEAYNISEGQGWYDTFQKMGVPKEQWDSLLEKLGPKLQEIHNPDGSPLTYFDKGSNQWLMNMTPDHKLPQSAIDLIAKGADLHPGGGGVASGAAESLAHAGGGGGGAGLESVAPGGGNANLAAEFASGQGNIISPEQIAANPDLMALTNIPKGETGIHFMQRLGLNSKAWYNLTRKVDLVKLDKDHFYKGPGGDIRFKPGKLSTKTLQTILKNVPSIKDKFGLAA